jgi:hypothetical protein
MEPREAFGIVVRSLGMISVVYAAWQLTFAFSLAAGFTTDDQYVAGDYVCSITSLTLIGLVLLRGADALVRFAYPTPTPTMPD